MHLLSYSMTDKFTNYTIMLGFAVLLYCITYISQPLAVDSILDTFVKGFLRCLQKLKNLRSDFADTKRIG